MSKMKKIDANELRSCSCQVNGAFYYFRGKTPLPNICKKYCQQAINEYSGKKISGKEFAKILEAIGAKNSQAGRSYYGSPIREIVIGDQTIGKSQQFSTCCFIIPKNVPHFSDLLTGLSKHNEIPWHLIELFALCDHYDKVLLPIVEAKYKSSCNRSYNFIEILVYRLLNHATVTDELCDMIVQYPGIESHELAPKICESTAKRIHYHLPNLFAKCGEMGKQILYYSLRALPVSYETCATLINRGEKITASIMKGICEYASDLEVALKNYSGDITDDLLEAVYKHKIYKKHPHLLRPHQRSTYNRNKNKPVYGWQPMDPGLNAKICTHKINQLIDKGYKPTYQDVCNAAKHCIEISDIEKYGIVADDKLLKLCWKYNFYPNYNFGNIDQRTIQLQKLCMKKQKPKIDTFLKKNDIVPDRKVMENACNFKNNKATVDMLVKKGGVISFECLKNCAQHSSTGNLMDILSYFEKQHKDWVASLNDSIDNKNKVAAKAKEDKVKEDKVKEDKVKKEPSKLKKRKTVKKKVELIDEVDEGDENAILSINSDEIKKEIDLRKKLKTPKLYSEYFKDTTKKMSFTELRKELICKITKNKWLSEDNKKLIKLPNDLLKSLGLQKGLVKFDDFDSLVKLFYK